MLGCKKCTKILIKFLTLRGEILYKLIYKHIVLPKSLCPSFGTVLLDVFASSYYGRGHLTCHCGDEFDKRTEGRGGYQCNDPCPGHSSYMCGGSSSYYSVYAFVKPSTTTELYTTDTGEILGGELLTTP